MSMDVHAPATTAEAALEPIVAGAERLAICVNDEQVFQIEPNAHGGLRITCVGGSRIAVALVDGDPCSLDVIEVNNHVATERLEVN